ncbi:MAG: glycine cleavage system protein GcvH [Candidatus Adiutricales bacterium]
MKERHELILPENLRYAEDHEWARLLEDNVRIGLSDYAQDQLGDIVFVELPEVGDTFEKGDEFGVIESVKAVVEMIIPVGGEVITINSALEEAPELVNQSPYEEGWLIEIRPSDPGEIDQLMDMPAYLDMLKGLKE